ncbi:hypothetical protein AAFF_G00376670 [Aldrovandia affinis]|uniref:Uncharacterized protein n=1 Tax=Aldrovandia affinis TaxID=143900 RepID=A0AAD7WLR2_9TELE|nr:hypothetical protein AAFF_G00376670 [Aldrovandia affinis]
MLGWGSSLLYGVLVNGGRSLSFNDALTVTREVTGDAGATGTRASVDVASPHLAAVLSQQSWLLKFLACFSQRPGILQPAPCEDQVVCSYATAHARDKGSPAPSVLRNHPGVRPALASGNTCVKTHFRSRTRSATAAPELNSADL